MRLFLTLFVTFFLMTSQALACGGSAVLGAFCNFIKEQNSKGSIPVLLHLGTGSKCTTGATWLPTASKANASTGHDCDADPVWMPSGSGIVNVWNGGIAFSGLQRISIDAIINDLDASRRYGSEANGALDNANMRAYAFRRTDLEKMMTGSALADKALQSIHKDFQYMEEKPGRGAFFITIR